MRPVRLARRHIASTARETGFDSDQALMRDLVIRT
jgi:hypothetical protein